MVKYGHTPTNFNISLITLIPKNGKAETVADYRPISVSTVYALMYESLLLRKTKLNNCAHKNQFGYKNKTSCKHAYFVVNETINYYLNGKSNVHLSQSGFNEGF